MYDELTRWRCDPDKVHILIADDEATTRALIRATLRKLRHTNVCEAETADEALSLCRQQNTDLIFLDIEMPGERNGLAVLHELREMGHSAYVVMVSAHSTLGYVRQAVAQRVNGFLVKPLGPDRIRQALEAFHQARF